MYRSVEILRGWSAAKYVNIAAIMWRYVLPESFVVCLTISIVIFAMPDGTRDLAWVIDTALVTFFVLMAVFGIGLTFKLQIRTSNEELQGYTSHRLNREDLPMTAPGTGWVIREAGQPFLSEEAYFQALKEIEAGGGAVDVPTRPRTAINLVIAVAVAAVVAAVGAALVIVYAARGPLEVAMPLIALTAGSAVVASFGIRAYVRHRRKVAHRN